MSVNSRALHHVLKVGSLKKNVEFFRDKLGMQVLRHEVFDQGCEAACNGPYSGKWSKTMIGYGPEDDYFVLELTYNYSVGSYKLGNDLHHIKIAMKQETFDRLKTSESNVDTSADALSLKSPDGYQFLITKTANTKQDVTEVCIGSSNLEKSVNYWTNLLKMRRVDDAGNKEEALLKYSDTQAGLRLKQIKGTVDHKSAFGRIAFSCPSADLKPIQAAIEAANEKVLTPYLSLDTPGKATVQVVILADPDGHEICFVGDEGFRELSKVDPEADNLIEKSISEDKSDEWFVKKGIKKEEA